MGSFLRIWLKRKFAFYGNMWLMAVCLIVLLGLIAESLVIFRYMQDIGIRNAFLACNVLAMIIVAYVLYSSAKKGIEQRTPEI